MGIRFEVAKATGAVLRVSLQNIARRDGANLPGRVACKIDPNLIAHLRERCREGSLVVVGTNGKTTVTNLIADAVEHAGKSVICNRTGANLRHGVASALMQNKPSDWGILECDELWTAKVLPQLKPTYVLLMNLFRDQLDRFGEIERIQDIIVSALGDSPDTVLIYNADDPLCTMIAERADALEQRAHVRSVAFGATENMSLEQNVVADATMCQRCSSMFVYNYRQYGQLGDYYCPTCGFKRPPLDYSISHIKRNASGISFELDADTAQAADAADAASHCNFHAPFSGAYMLYNLAACAIASLTLGCTPNDVQAAIDAFHPQNGRLQSLEIAGRQVLLNLAKNPTGFNQNLKIIREDKNPKVVGFFINDKEADGHDISWIWDIDFEELVQESHSVVFAGGIRKQDLRVRLKYAGVSAELVDDASEMFSKISGLSDLPASAHVYAIANYTALPAVKSSLEAAAAHGVTNTNAQSAPQAVATHNSANTDAPDSASPDAAYSSTSTDNPLVIAHLYPDLLNLYGDGGNVRILAQRCRWRKIPVEVNRVCFDDELDLDNVDLVFLGGGPDREQKLACEKILTYKEPLTRFINEGGALLAICGGYQILGDKWLLGDEEVPGLSVLDITTRRPGTSAERLIDNIVLRSTLAARPVVGYENHAGRTYLRDGVECFGHVISACGHGNNDDDKTDGVIYQKLIGTYSHGPLLSKNPEIADALLTWALERHAKRSGCNIITLSKLDDTEEIEANTYMCKRLGVTAP